eukprot:7560519-Pyramimonas_sp.AAC.1
MRRPGPFRCALIFTLSLPPAWATRTSYWTSRSPLGTCTRPRISVGSSSRLSSGSIGLCLHGLRGPTGLGGGGGGVRAQGP